MERISDEALVVRGGANRPVDIQRGIGIHPSPSGVSGVSVQSAAGVSLAELAAAIPHTQVGVTTVEEVRQAGGDVIRTSGRSPYHATLTGLFPEQMSALLTPTIANPARET
ncbi:flavoredoxin [Coleofasciculus sp. FACHB-1120]|nr:flavoredoxin [Coleofasciculus sp. FACHB-1120]